jgi:hypothetical protein
MSNSTQLKNDAEILFKKNIDDDSDDDNSDYSQPQISITSFKPNKNAMRSSMILSNNETNLGVILNFKLLNY